MTKLHQWLLLQFLLTNNITYRKDNNNFKFFLKTFIYCFTIFIEMYKI